MPMPFAVALVYLAVNLAMMLWIERERAAGRTTPHRVGALSSVMRYGPPLLGAGYLVTMAGDWLFVLFVLGFFAAGFWLLDGMLAANPSSRTDVMRGGGPDRDALNRPGPDRDRS